MKGKLKILMVFPEVAPFVKTGEIGDVGGALPKALKEMGHDVRVITPQYRTINERKYILRDVIRLQNIDISLGGENVCIDVKSAFLPNSKVQVYFIDYKPFFFKEGLYADSKSGKNYADNDQRFILFSKGVLKTLIKLQWQPDVIHCHDWQSGLIPFFLETVYRDDPFFGKTFTLFTIHNLNLQGNFNPKCISYMVEDSQSDIPADTIKFQEQCSFLKAGVVYSDIVNATNEKYSQKVAFQLNGKNHGENILLWRKDKAIHSVANGIDYSVWNPELDQLIAETYSISDLDGKEENKQALLKNQGLPVSPKIPVIGMLSHLMDQAGMDLVQNCFNELMKMGVYFIFLGKGDKSFRQSLGQIHKKNTDRVGVNFSHDESLNHLLIAGADILLMSSNHTILESNKLYCLKYGTIPIIYFPKGSEEIIRPFDSETGKGAAFIFKGFDRRQFLKAVKRAVRTFEDQKLWLKIMKNGMREDFSWHHSSKKYIKLYLKCISKKK